MNNSSRKTTTTVAPGAVLKNRYQIVNFLGRGGSGTVYACKDKMMGGSPVALKILHPEVVHSEHARQNVQNEISTAFNVHHHNVVQALGWFTDGPHMAYTMEYVPGIDLGESLKLHGSYSPGRCCEIMMQLCEGVAAIHEQEIIHRDLKPENILLGKGMHVKITDFGIAVTSDTLGLRKETGIVGTHEYVSPEYITGAQIDYRTDIYSLGIIGYELLTGTTPFASDNMYQSLDMKVADNYIPIQSVRPEIPTALCAIIEKAMACNPEDRYQSAIEFLDAIRGYLTPVKQSSSIHRLKQFLVDKLERFTSVPAPLAHLEDSIHHEDCDANTQDAFYLMTSDSRH